MKRSRILFFAIVLAGTQVVAQPEGVVKAQQSLLPVLTVNDRSIALQASLYPSLYWTTSVIEDLAWVRKHDSALVQFAQLRGDSIFQALSDFSGIAWRDEFLELSLLRYYPSVGAADPLVVPIGGVRVGALSEAIPEGPVRQLELIYLLAHRVLLNGLRAEAPTFDLLSNHPLMQPTPLRRDNLAFLLALAVSDRVLGADSSRQAYQSPFWKRHLLGREVFDQYFLRQWVLSKERPLTRWLAEEVSDSRLVEVTDLAIQQNAAAVGRRPMIEGVSPVGRLGFSVRLGPGGQLVVDKIDNSRTAHRSGLRSGDIIRSVDGKKPKNHKELIELILDKLESGGAMLAVTRGGMSETVFVQPAAAVNTVPNAARTPR